ncbi:MAG: hypothetical protein WAZ14_01595 [Patescibacteria group bacterium]
MEMTKEQLKDVFSEVMDEKFRVNNEQLIQMMDDEFRYNNDLLLQEMRAVENRIEKNFDNKLTVTKDEILAGVADLVGGSILPQMDNHEDRLVVLETKISVKG